MCNIAGYVGTKQAAPILLEMFRKQEGWDCGHYTGVATIDKTGLHVEKDIGHLEMLLANHDVANMPGTVGVIHGRTPGGPGQENWHWAHPFVGDKGRFAMVVNGCGGKFTKTVRQQNVEAYMELKAAGYRFDSLTDTGRPGKEMPDGKYLHPSDILTQMVQYNYDHGMVLSDACAAANIRITTERVCLCVNADEPDCITWTRINYPMFAGYCDHGMYLATTPQAMPDDARNITLLTACASGRVYCDRIETKPFRNHGFTVAPITPQVWKKAYESMEQALQEKEMHHDHLDVMLRPIFEDASCVPESAVNYAIMDRFERQGRLCVNRTFVKGTAPDSVAPKIFARLR